MAADCDVQHLVESVYTAIEQNDDSALRILCGAIRLLSTSCTRPKLDPLVYMSLLYIAKVRPNIFCSDVLNSALTSSLRRDVNIKTRQSSQSHIVNANILTRAYSDKIEWPEQFIRIYVEDSMNERFWCDNDLCKALTDNICASFNTRNPPVNLLQLDIFTTPNQHHREAPSNFEENQESSCLTQEASNIISDDDSAQMTNNFCLIRNRYLDNKNVEKYISEAIKDQLNKRQQNDCYTRNFLKFLCSVTGVAEVRYLCISRLELWIHNAKLVKFAQQLLSYICFNIKSNILKDYEVMTMLVKLRLKTKPLINFYMICLKEMIVQQPDVLSVLLKLVVQNELSNTRNPNNMGMLATMFQTCPEISAGYLAEIYREFLLQREDCLRTLRVFLRELARMLRFDINVPKFCNIFLSNRPEICKQIQEAEFNERIFHSMVDLTCLCMLLSVSPQVREATLTPRSNRDFKISKTITNFYSQMSQIQLDAVSWMYETVPHIFKLQSVDYNQALYKLLLLENAEQYSRYDQWPSDPERATLLRIVSETPIQEEALLRIILIGITKDIPFKIPDTIEIIMLVLKRASLSRITNCPAVQTNKFDIIDFLFNMTEYHHPENLILPSEYEPPKLAVTTLYWKALLIMLMISAHNPATFGAFCWDHYPTMKMFMEMCITNQFNDYPEVKSEYQIVSLERETILEFETHLAAQTSQTVITEENSILIPQLMLMNPMGPARKVPCSILDQLKHLNKTLKLGHLLCRCRKPDLLLDIIQRQGTTQSMPWLSDLVLNSEGDFNHLPVQCLCEFLLFNANVINEENSRDGELLNFLRTLITGEETNKQSVCEVLDYIFRRLSSTVQQSRIAALRGLKILFKCFDKSENDWLISCIPNIPHFRHVRPFIIPQLRAACQVENSPQLVMTYIQFIAAHTLNDSVIEMLDHVIDMAQLIVERSTMFQYIVPNSDDLKQNLDNTDNHFQTLKCLFVMFNNYIIKLREHSQPYECPEYPDLLMVQFEDEVQLPLHLNVIHAFIILLTHFTNEMPELTPILEYWFPKSRRLPIAFLPNMPHESVQLIPDWLKLKMIRSTVESLIEAALKDLTPDQIVLFVQNFGTPINSMSKLLALLDHAVLEQQDSVKNAILNKSYLAQLIEIQQVRGAKNGHYTMQVLGLHSYSQPTPCIYKISSPNLQSICMKELKNKSPLDLSLRKNVESAEEILKSTIKNSRLITNDEFQFRHSINQIINMDSNTATNILTNTANLLAYNFEEENISKYKIISIFRILFKFIKQFGGALNLQYLIKEVSEKVSKKTNLPFHESSINIHYLISLNNMFEYQLNILSDAVTKNQSREIISEFCKDGLFVDWLSEIDPELVAAQQDISTNVLFSREKNNFRYFLLSRLCHETNWKTLVRALDFLLRQSSDACDCSSILNFIESLINNPKLWQGRDKSATKTVRLEQILILEDHEINAFAQLILKEGELEMGNTTANYDYKLYSRINLVLRVTNKKDEQIVKFIEYITKYQSSYTLQMKVLQQLYLLRPSVQFVKNCFNGDASRIRSLKGCQADNISNYLITYLGNLISKKDYESLSSDIELLIRKLAASHPDIFLRQLGVVSSLIQEKSQISVKTLREEFHIHRFIQILRILELLQPSLFDETYKNELQSILDCYFKYFKHHGSIKESYHMVLKFVDLLQAYIHNNPKSALSFMDGYVEVLMDLPSNLTSIPSLHQLIQGLTLLQHNSVGVNEVQTVEISKQEIETEEYTETKIGTIESDLIEIAPNTHQGTTCISSNFSSKPTSISPHFLNLIKLVKQSNSDDAILTPLQEIESLTSKRFSYLNEIFDRLLQLIFSPNAQIRSNSFILLIRHLKHNPGRRDINRCALNAYIQCLRDDNPSVSATAVDNLAEMTVLLQEHATAILSVAFNIGIKSHVNTLTQIKRVLQTLMLQHGY